MNIGILGVGVIGSAIIEGFCLDGDNEHQLFISPRSEHISKSLQKNYTQVTRCNNNQELLDKSDLVIISILPKVGLEVITNLKFRSDQHVINLMSDKTLDEIKIAIGKTKTLVHMVPLSFISKREGPIAFYPSNEFILNLFQKLGHIIQVDDVKKIESIAAITGLMTSYYKLVNDITNWGSENGLTHNESKDYTTHFFEALSKHASQSNLERLSTEMTPGGINEKAIQHIINSNGFDPWVNILESLAKKLKHK